MQLERCSDQRSQTLDEFYEDIAKGEYPDRGKAMLDLIARLRALPDTRRLFGLTSLDDLCLLAQDTYLSPWYVRIAVLSHTSYFIEYLMPAAVAPWPGAQVRGEAHSEDETVEMVLTAMERSGGWSD